MRDTEDRERVLLVDVSTAANSAKAVGLVESFIQTTLLHRPSPEANTPQRVNLVGGTVFLTQGVLLKINQLFKENGFQLETVYSSVPQTQQAALDEGYFVKEAPQAPRTPQLQSKSALASFFDPAQRLDIKEALPAPDARSTQTAVASSELSDAVALPFSESPPEQKTATAVATPPHDPAPLDLVPLNADTAPSSEKGQEIDIAPTHSISSKAETLYLKQNLRSGQTIRFEGNIVIIGDVHAGSEVTATGDITVWGELKGIAHAGSQGNYKAEIRALKIEAIQLRISDYIARRPDRIFYHKGLGNAGYAPELAKVADGEIKIIQDVIGK